MLSEQTRGQPGWSLVNTTYTAFDMDSLFLFCAANLEVPVGPVFVGCTLQFTGVRASDGQTVVQEGSFNPATLPTANKYTFVQFSKDFTGLKSLSIQLIQSVTPQRLTVPIMDNFAYDAYYKTC